MISRVKSFAREHKTTVLLPVIVGVAAIILAQLVTGVISVGLDAVAEVGDDHLGMSARVWHVGVVAILTVGAFFAGRITQSSAVTAPSRDDEILKFGIVWPVRSRLRGDGTVVDYVVSDPICPKDKTTLGWKFFEERKEVLPLPLYPNFMDDRFPPLVLACHKDGCGRTFTLDEHTLAEAKQLVDGEAMGKHRLKGQVSV